MNMNPPSGPGCEASPILTPLRPNADLYLVQLGVTKRNSLKTPNIFASHCLDQTQHQIEGPLGSRELHLLAEVLLDSTTNCRALASTAEKFKV